MKFRMTAVLVCAGLVQFAASSAQELGDAKRGQTLAETVCAECHATAKGQPRSRNGKAPTFETLANLRGMTPLALRVALRSPHKEMPNLVLTNQEVDDIYAYVSTLKDRKS